MGNPVYLDGAGNPITTIPCGTPATFNVPGYSKVWLEQKRNGFSTFDGPYSVPSPAYSAACDRDVGTYQNTVYELTDGAKGNLIGSVAAVVTLGSTFNNNPPAGGSGCVSCYTAPPAGGGNYAPGGGNSPGAWGGGKPAVGGRDTSTSGSSTTTTTTTAAASSAGIPWGLVLLVLLAIAILRR